MLKITKFKYVNISNLEELQIEFEQKYFQKRRVQEKITNN